MLTKALPSGSSARKDDVVNTISEIEYTLKKVGLFTIPWREHQQAQREFLNENFDAMDDDNSENVQSKELVGINDDILLQLTSHVYSVVSINPPVLYIADSREKYIIKAVIRFDREDTQESKNVKGQSQKIITRQQKLNYKDKIILAIPRRIVINNNLLTETRTYTITFVSKIDKKPFTIGPGSIDYIIGELDSKNKVLKKLDAGEALRAILNRYEEKGLAEVNESVTQPGYYYINKKFIANEITQIIDKGPDREQVLACANLLDELSTKWQNKDIFPTVIKWFTLAPFDYIFKSVNKWLTNFHDHGWSSSGKTTEGKIGLAIWRLHTNALRKDYQLGFGNIDNSARLGSVISRSTYPKVINEVGGLKEKINRPLLEIIKQQIESPFVRGKYLDGKYQNIPALCKLFMTSNPRPPDDSGYRSKTTIIHHSKDEVHERGQKEAIEFEKWLEPKLDLLGVLGDFIVQYVIFKPEKPEQSVLFSTNASYDDMAKEIIAEFYKLAGKGKPEWLDRTYEQRSIFEENTERAYFEIRAFLMNQISEAYNRYIRTMYRDHDPGIVIDLLTRMNFCLKNKLIPYLHEHIRKDGVEEIRITHGMLTELRRKVDHLEGVTTMKDLAKELPGFQYINGKIGPKSGWILAGKSADFIAFLEGKIED